MPEAVLCGCGAHLPAIAIVFCTIGIAETVSANEQLASSSLNRLNSSLWERRCGVACRHYIPVEGPIGVAREACERHPYCPAIVDFSNNGGSFAICRDADFVTWSNICVEHFNRAVYAAREGGLDAGASLPGSSSNLTLTQVVSAHVSPSKTLTSEELALEVEEFEHTNGMSYQGFENYEQFAYHKEMLPLCTTDYVALALCALGLILAAGGGIGGGGIIVPLYMLVLRFHPKHAIALSNVTILGGAIVNFLFNAQKRFPDGRPHIDWDIIVMMEPSTIVGSVIGAFGAKLLPDFTLTITLAIVLSYMGYKTLKKGLSLYDVETEELKDQFKCDIPMELTEKAQKFARVESEESRPLNSLGREDTSRSLNAQMALLTERSRDRWDVNFRRRPPGFPCCKLFLLILCFGGCVILTLLKGSKHIGVQCGSELFYVLSFATVPFAAIFVFAFRQMLLAETTRLEMEGTKYIGAISWNSRTTFSYPIISSLAGVFAGLFGVGGGIVKGPLMLALGVDPPTASATSATMILFTSSAACISYYDFGLVHEQYGMLMFVVGIVCTTIGQAGMDQWMKSASRQSPPVLSIGLVLCLSSLLVGIEAIMRLFTEDISKLFRPEPMCSSA